MYWKWSAEVAVEVEGPVPSLLVAVMSTMSVSSATVGDAESAGLTTVQLVVEVQLTEVPANEPKANVVDLPTVPVAKKPVPVTVTVVPPVYGPLAAYTELVDTAVMVGVGALAPAGAANARDIPAMPMAVAASATPPFRVNDRNIEHLLMVDDWA